MSSLTLTSTSLASPSPSSSSRGFGGFSLVRGARCDTAIRAFRVRARAYDGILRVCVCVCDSC